MIKRYRFVLFLAATMVFVVVALSVAVWPLIAGTLPAGVRSAGPVATLTVRNTDGRSGIRVSALEAIKDVAGVRSVYYANGATQFLLTYGEREVDVAGSFVNDAYFPSLGVAIRGTGFNKFSPWQRNLRKECVLGQSLEQELSGGSGKSLLGEDIDINGRSCTVVGLVDEAFSGMRPPRVIRLWITWPSQIGLGVPEIAPDEFLDMETRAREVGLVLEPDVPLGAIETAIGTQLRQPGHAIRDHRLLPGDGVEPGPRHRMLRQIRLILLAVGTLLAVILIFAMTYALWHSESIRGTQGIRLALGATAQRLIRKAALDTAIQAGLSLIAGAIATSVIWRLLLAQSDLGAEYLQIPRAQTTDSILLATIAVLGLALCTWLFEVRVWLKPGKSGLVWTLRRFAATSPIETVVGGLIVAATLSSTLLAAWILDDFRRLSEVPRGYGNSDVTTLAFSSPQNPLQWFAKTRDGHSVESVNQALAAMGGKVQVAMSQSVPFHTGGGAQGIMRTRPESNPVSIFMQSNRVSRNFFELYRIKFLEGTTFQSTNAREIILSESAARNLIGEPPWAGKNVRLEIDEMSGGTRLVVGVVSDVAYNGRNAAIPEMFYMPIQSMGDALVLSFAEPVPADLPNIANLFQRMGITDPLDPPVRIRVKDADDDRVGRVRALVLLAACVLAVLLGAIGLAEILLVVANRRLNELALRSALGATTGRLAWSAFRKQMPALVAGLMTGVAFFALATSHLVSRGFDVSPPSPAAWVQAVLALLILLLLVMVPSLFKLRRIPVALLLKQD